MTSHARNDQRRPMWREFLLFIGALYGMGTSTALAMTVYLTTVSRELQPRIGVPYLLLLVVVFAWIGGYSFARWVRS